MTNEGKSQTPMQPLPPDEEEGGGIAIDPRAIAIALFGYRYWLAGGIAMSLGIGLLIAQLFAERTYTAETVMLYQAPPIESPEAATIPSLNTLLSMVKLSSNLEDVREKLQLPVDIRVLGAAISVDLQQRTTLVAIKARWDSPKTAADIANTLRDAFLENQARLRREDAEVSVAEIQNRLTPVREELRLAEEALRTFTTENRVVHLSQEARATLDELSSVNLLVEQARIEKSSLEIQVENADRLIKELEARLAVEQEAAAALSDAMSETNIRIQRLRESISDDKEQRSNDAILTQAQLSLERAEQLHADGILSEKVLEEEKANFLSIQARAVDTPQIEAWRQEIEKLDQQVLPKGDASGGLSGNLLKDIMYLAFQIRLQQTSAVQKLDSLLEAQSKVEERLSRMPALQRTHAELTRNIESSELEKRDLEVRLSEALRLLEASSLPFILVAEAIPPMRSSSSNKKKLFAASVVLLSGAWVSLFAAFSILDPRIRSRKELELALDPIPVLEELPLSEKIEGDPACLDHLRVLARRIKTIGAKKSLVLMIVSAGSQEGVGPVTRSLAEIFCHWEHKVLVIDAQLPRAADENATPSKPSRFSGLLESLRHRGLRLSRESSPVAGDRGLAEYLMDRSLTPNDLISNSDDRLYDFLSAGTKHASPDLLATSRMKDLVLGTRENHDIVLIQSPPVLQGVDAEHLSILSDSVVLIVEAHQPFGSAIKESLGVLAVHQVPIIGGVLTNVRPEFSSNS